MPGRGPRHRPSDCQESAVALVASRAISAPLKCTSTASRRRIPPATKASAEGVVYSARFTHKTAALGIPILPVLGVRVEY
jgi:hypothetical protein